MVQFEEQYRVVIAPSINASLFDLVLRRAKEEKIFFGILMGTRSDFGGLITIRSCYPIAPKSFSSLNAQVMTIIELHKCVYQKDYSVGFFYLHTDKLDLVSEEVEKFKGFYMREIHGNAVQLTAQVIPGKPIVLEARNLFMQMQGESGKKEIQSVPLECVVECPLSEHNLCKLMYEGLSEENSYIEGDSSIVLESYSVNLTPKAENALNSLVNFAYSVLGEA